MYNAWIIQLYKQHNIHTDLWMKIILTTGVMVIPFWYETHTFLV